MSVIVNLLCRDAIDRDVVDLVVTVFSIFAGFLVAIIAMVGESTLVSAGNWRNAQDYKDRIVSHLDKLKALLMLYLFTLVLIFFALLFSPFIGRAGSWLTFTYMTLATIAMSYSAFLPGWMISFHKWKLKEIVEIKRREAGIRD